jgi:hypothetical protein
MRLLSSSVLALSTVALLSACGGGGDVFFDNEPHSSGRSGSVTVTAAGDPNLNGVYSSSDVQLNDVVKFNPIGGDPETCRSRFSGLAQAPGAQRLMDGDIRYLPGTTALQVTFVSINTIEFRLQGTQNATVDRANNVVTYAGAVLTSTQGSGQSITMTGTIPLRAENKPEGC